VKKFVDQRGPKFPVVGDVDPCWVSFSVRTSYTADHGRFASGTERVEPTDHLSNCLHLGLLNLLDLVSDAEPRFRRACVVYFGDAQTIFVELYAERECSFATSVDGAVNDYSIWHHPSRPGTAVIESFILIFDINKAYY
jgi:hypothetical protein